MCILLRNSYLSMNRIEGTIPDLSALVNVTTMWVQPLVSSIHSCHPFMSPCFSRFTNRRRGHICWVSFPSLPQNTVIESVLRHSTKHCFAKSPILVSSSIHTTNETRLKISIFSSIIAHHNISSDISTTISRHRESKLSLVTVWQFGYCSEPRKKSVLHQGDQTKWME